jgi:hypothetical protein
MTAVGGRRMGACLVRGVEGRGQLGGYGQLAMHAVGSRPVCSFMGRGRGVVVAGPILRGEVWERVSLRVRKATVLQDVPGGCTARWPWSSADFAGEAAKTGGPPSLLFSDDARESGVRGASASRAWGSSSVGGFSSTAGGGSGALCVTVPLLDSSGVMGRAAGMLALRERDRRCGMAGTMRESGRRACLCAAGAVSATMGAMVVRCWASAECGSVGGLRQRLQVSAASFLANCPGAPWDGRDCKGERVGGVGVNTRRCNGYFRSTSGQLWG